MPGWAVAGISSAVDLYIIISVAPEVSPWPQGLLNGSFINFPARHSFPSPGVQGHLGNNALQYSLSVLPLISFLM